MIKIVPDNAKIFYKFFSLAAVRVRQYISLTSIYMIEGREV